MLEKKKESKNAITINEALTADTCRGEKNKKITNYNYCDNGISRILNEFNTHHFACQKETKVSFLFDTIYRNLHGNTSLYRFFSMFSGSCAQDNDRSGFLLCNFYEYQNTHTHTCKDHQPI